MGSAKGEPKQERLPYDSHHLIREMHHQFMAGEISQGKMAEMLGISRIDLIHLLETMDLQITNL